MELSNSDPQRQVRFHLFGKFRTVVDGKNVPFKDAKFFTYLKLYLLSGQTYLDNDHDWEFWVLAKDVRDPLNDGNLDPEVSLRKGSYDFTGITGLSFRYRDGLGIGIQEEHWQSDIREFEDVWARRTSASKEELQQALEVFGKGVDLSSWRRDPTFNKCFKWVRTRLTELTLRKEEIQAELDGRRDSEERGVSGAGAIAIGDLPGGLSDEGIHHETSGLINAAPGIEPAAEDSAPLRQELREAPVPDEPAKDAAPTEGSGQAGPGQETEVVQLFAEEGGLKTEPVASSSSVQSESERGRKEGNSGPPDTGGKRTVTALGVVVVASILGLVFFAGYMIARSTNASSGSHPPANMSKGDDTPSGLSERSESKSTEDSQPIVRAERNPIDLMERYNQDVSGMGTYYKEGDIVIGRQLFTGYISPWTGPVDCSTSGVFKLESEFSALKCAVGVPDSDSGDFENDDREVVFEADGRLLKVVQIKPGPPKSVELPVKNVKALIISFGKPVVLVNAKLYR